MNERHKGLKIYGPGFTSEVMEEYDKMLSHISKRVDVSRECALLLSSVCVVQKFVSSVDNEEMSDSLFSGLIKNMHMNYKLMKEQKKDKGEGNRRS